MRERKKNQKKENWIRSHKYSLVGLYLFVFLLGFLLMEIYVQEPKYILHCFFDDWIPFCEWFIIPYFLWYAWVPAIMLLFMFKDRKAYLRLCLLMFTGATLCLIIYMIWPTGLDLRREIMADNFCADLVRFIRSVDPACNVCPSIHVSSTVSVHLAVCSSEYLKEKRGVRSLSWGMTLGICLSTLFVKQHSVIDVVCGWALSQGLEEIWQVVDRKWFGYQERKRSSGAL